MIRKVVTRLSVRETATMSNTGSHYFLQDQFFSHPQCRVASTISKVARAFRAAVVVSGASNCSGSDRPCDASLAEAATTAATSTTTGGRTIISSSNNNDEDHNYAGVQLGSKKDQGSFRVKQQQQVASAQLNRRIRISSPTTADNNNNNMLLAQTNHHHHLRTCCTTAAKYPDHSSTTFSLVGRKFLISCAIVLTLCSIYSHPFVGASEQQSGAQSTIAYGDPIKWSFGGWAPLNGMMNGTSGALMNRQQQQHHGSNTSPLPAGAPTARPSQGLHNHTARAAAISESTPKQDSLRESASNTVHEKLQFSGASSPSGHSNNNPTMMQMSANSLSYQQQPPKLQIGPAYALPMQRSPQPQQFSQPAPTPIVREHVLPPPGSLKQQASAPVRQQRQHPAPMNGGHFGPQHPRMHYMASQQQQQQHNHQHHHRHPAESEPQRAHHHQHMIMMQPPHMRPPGYHRHQKFMHEHNQHQHQMFQQMMNQQEQQMYPQAPNGHRQPAPPSPAQQARSQHMAYMRPTADAAAEQVRAPIPRYPGSPLLHHHAPQQQQQPYQQQTQQAQREPQYQQLPLISPYKQTDGEERPIAYTNSQLPDERIPLLEINGANNRNGSEQQQQHEAGKLGGEPMPASAGGQLHGSAAAAAAANEEKNNNFGYQNALGQVASYMAADEHGQAQELQLEQPQSNNIQDIKQRQQYEQNQRKAPAAANENAQADKTIAASGGPRSPYLTIPVAVETEGDKVLTPDDIKEIEKHVIKVFPSISTAEKIVKLADAQLSLAAGIKAATAATMATPDDHQQLRQQVDGPEMHQMHYNEHRMTLKQLEGDHKQQQQQVAAIYGGGHSAPEQLVGGPSQQPHEASATTGYAEPHGSTRPMMQAVAQQQASDDDDHSAQLEQAIRGSSRAPGGASHEYFVATGPIQELDGDQISDYNLINPDLLNTFHYEPTRAGRNGAGSSPWGSRGPQTEAVGSTPPMPYTAAAAGNQSRPSEHAAYSLAEQQPTSHGPQPPTPRPLRHSFGRLAGGRVAGGGSYGAGSTTKTIMGGRRVSDVMRSLIRTTPVPMTSPLHVQSVEPEKVDAIQLIAGKARDNQPMVVEPHQLVNHTPDGGFDFGSGAPLGGEAGAREPQPSDQQPIHVDDQEQRLQLQQPPRQQPQYLMATGAPKDNGGIIEYVAMNEPADQNSNNQQQQQHATYEVSGGQPEAPAVSYMAGEQENKRENNNRPVAQPIYDYTMTTQPINGDGGYANQQQEQQHEQPSMPWSPSIANEHQQQQLELAEHAAPMDMPATAGYNFFSQQQEQPPPTTRAHEYEQQQQQQQHDDADEQPKRWRTKAGGSQPNPDAQYDGQMAKGEHEQEHEQEQHNQVEQGGPNQRPIDPEIHQQQQQQPQYSNYANQQAIELSRLTQSGAASRPQEDHEHEHQQQNDNEPNDDAYQQHQPQHLQQQAQPEQQQAHPYGQQERQQVTHTQQQPEDNGGQKQQVDGYMSTTSYGSGAQFNQQAPSSGKYEPTQQEQHQFDGAAFDNGRPQHDTGSKFNYVRLDTDRQSAHLAQQQAQRQAQLAELRAAPGPTGSGGYAAAQTTTPMSLVIDSSAGGHANQPEAVQQQEQETGGQVQQDDKMPTTTIANNGYIVEQVQSRPSVQSSPDSMLLGDAPMQLHVSDQQSLLPTDPNQESDDQFSDDDRAKQQQHGNKQQAGTAVYQVYQAYYAPKDHKPLPGYVRLSLDEFNELFRDAEIQYVDKNMNGLHNAMSHNNREASSGDYEQQDGTPNDMMKSSASEQSIVVDRRSITGGNAINSSAIRPTGDDASVGSDIKLSMKNKQGEQKQSIKKIISIRNSRLTAKQQQMKATKMTPPPTLTTKKTVTGITAAPPITTNTPNTYSPDATGRQKKKTEVVLRKQKTIHNQSSPTTPAATTANAKQSKPLNNSQVEASLVVITHNLGDKKLADTKAKE